MIRQLSLVIPFRLATRRPSRCILACRTESTVLLDASDTISPLSTAGNHRYLDIEMAGRILSRHTIGLSAGFMGPSKQYVVVVKIGLGVCLAAVIFGLIDMSTYGINHHRILATCGQAGMLCLFVSMLWPNRWWLAIIGIAFSIAGMIVFFVNK